MSEPKQIEVTSMTQWHKWLEKNHDKEKSVAVIVHKKHTGKPILYHNEMMCEAICFGWIDTTIKRLDHNRFIRHFARRGPNSKWSDNTIKYGKQLIKEGRMTSAGLAAFKHGLSRPTHDADIPKNPDVPDDLKKALSKNKKAKEGFDSLAPSYRRMYLRWLLGAKLPETKKKRIDLIVQRCSQGKKFGIN